MDDWLIATDDLFCARWPCCTLCGGRSGERWCELHTLGALALAVTLCQDCNQRDKQRVQVTALLQARYKGGGRNHAT